MTYIALLKACDNELYTTRVCEDCHILFEGTIQDLVNSVSDNEQLYNVINRNQVDRYKIEGTKLIVSTIKE